MDEKFGENGVETEVPTGALAAVAKKVAEAGSVPELLGTLHKLMHGSFNKGDFSASIFEMISAGELIDCPKYIADALRWLEGQLEPSQESEA